jgi:hypothetical protein
MPLLATIFAIMICLSPAPPIGACHWYGGSRDPILFPTAEACEKARAERAEPSLHGYQVEGRYTAKAVCVKKDVPSWEPIE